MKSLLDIQHNIDIRMDSLAELLTSFSNNSDRDISAYLSINYGDDYYVKTIVCRDGERII